MSNRRIFVLALATAGALALALPPSSEAKRKPAPPASTLDGTWDVTLTVTISSCKTTPPGTIRLTSWEIAPAKGGWRITTQGTRTRGHAHTWTGHSSNGAMVLDGGRTSSGELRAHGATLQGSLVELIGGRAPCAVVYRAHGIPPTPAPQPVAQGAAHLPTTGVPECDHYLSATWSCLDQVITDPTARTTARDALRKAAEQFVAMPANARGNLAQACTTALDAARKAFQQQGCNF